MFEENIGDILKNFKDSTRVNVDMATLMERSKGLLKKDNFIHLALVDIIL